jgi:hypothetical protein
VATFDARLHSAGAVFLKHKVLRISAAGQFIPSRLTRINRDSNRCSLAVKGDAVTYGPNLVAWSVVSERRNHHPRQVIIQTQPVINRRCLLANERSSSCGTEQTLSSPKINRVTISSQFSFDTAFSLCHTAAGAGG